MYQIEDVFSPKSFPENTYVTRKSDEYEIIDDRFKKALAMKENLIFIAGVSKSGKTVLCHKTIVDGRMIALSGNQVNSKEEFWCHIAEQLSLTNTSTVANARTFTEKQITKYLIDNKKILVIDDFHYMSKDVQMYVARTLKTELFNGLKAVIISLPYRSDEAIICNPDLIGRTMFIKIPAWSKEELCQIAVKGFELLDIKISASDIELLAQESVASPQLMQDNCFNLAFIVKDENASVTKEFVHRAFRATAFNYDQYSWLSLC